MESKFILIVLPLLVSMTCCKLRPFNQAANTQSIAQTSKTENDILGVLTKEYNPFDYDIAYLNDWALAEVVTLASEDGDTNSPFLVVLKLTNRKWTVVKRIDDATLSLGALRDAGIPATIASEVFSKIHYGLTGVELAVREYLNDNFNPYSSKFAYRGNWAYAEMELVDTSSASMYNKWVVATKKEGVWVTFAEIQSPQGDPSTSELELAGVPSAVAEELYNRVMYGWSSAESEIYKVLSGKFNPYRSIIATQGIWSLAEITTLSTTEMTESRPTQVLLRHEGVSWAIKANEDELSADELTSKFAVPKAIAVSIEKLLVKKRLDAR